MWNGVWLAQSPRLHQRGGIYMRKLALYNRAQMNCWYISGFQWLFGNISFKKNHLNTSVCKNIYTLFFFHFMGGGGGGGRSRLRC